MGVYGSHDIRIVDTSFRRNAQPGIHVVDSTDILIKGNLLARNSDMGILMEADRNQVRGDRCARNGACVIVSPGSRNVIAGNRSCRDGGGILIERGRGNLVARNVVVRARLDGIHLGLEEPPVGGANNAVRRDVVRGSGHDGVAVAEHDRRSFLGANIAIAAGDDGFDVESRSARLTSNRRCASRPRHPGRVRCDRRRRKHRPT